MSLNSNVPTVSQWKANSWSRQGRGGGVFGSSSAGTSGTTGRLPSAPSYGSGGSSLATSTGMTDEAKRNLLELIKNFNEEFTFDEGVDPWANERLWSIISSQLSTMNGEVTFTSKVCKTVFSGLFSRYFLLLKQKKPINEARFPFFSMMHNELNLTMFGKDIAQLKTEFDESNKGTLIANIEERILSTCESAAKRPISEESSDSIGQAKVFDGNKQGSSKKFAGTSNASSSNRLSFDDIATKTNSAMRLDKRDFKVDDSLVGKTFRSRFFVHEILKKKHLIDAIYKFNSDLLSYSYEDVWEAEEVWTSIKEHVNLQVPEYSVTHCQVYFRDLFFQYRYILERLRHWEHQRAIRFWPFFEMFHTKLNLRSFFYQIDTLKEQFDNCPKDYIDDEDEPEARAYLPEVIPKNYFYIHQCDEKEKILNAIMKYSEEFSSLAKLGDLWDTDQIWKFVVKDLQIFIEKFTIKKCKNMFISVLDQYITLTRDLNFLGIEEAKELFRLFDIFHSKLCLTPFWDETRDFKNRWVSNAKISEANKSTTSDKNKTNEKSRNTVGTVTALSESKKDENEDEDDENIELVLSVRDHLKEFKDYTVADDDIWMRIALDLNKFEPAVVEKGKTKWRERFYELMRKYFQIASEYSEEEAQQRWILFNQFSSFNMNPFLDRLQNPVTETKMRK